VGSRIAFAARAAKARTAQERRLLEQRMKKARGRLSEKTMADIKRPQKRIQFTSSAGLLW